ncbi:hypothetical protein ACIBCM_00955 [Streptomyces sp. NPDC051018]|uniref:hypothetical protein n=1 Tax=Streptomyces sp. NPDC051018 TaxID=3365639 RepID=UPI0037AD6381
MTSIPGWWGRLTTSSASRDLGISWREPGEWEPSRRDNADSTMRTLADSELDESVSGGKLLVGSGPGVTTRLFGADVPVEWYLDPSEQPSRLWCALGDFYGPRLWIPVAPEPAALAEVIGRSHPKPALRRTDMPRFTRGFLGLRGDVKVPHIYSGDLVEINGHDLDRYFTLVQYVEHEAWGSSLLDDPLADDIEFVNPLVMAASLASDTSQAQLRGRIPSKTWRTLHSRSYLSFEIQSQHSVYVSVRYRPSPPSHHQVVERINAETSNDFPPDLPLDVIGAVSGFTYHSERELEEMLKAPESPGQLADALRIFAGFWAGDLRRSRLLGEFADHPAPEVRTRLARIAYWYGYRWLADELALTETEPSVRLQMENIALGQVDDHTYNAFDDYYSGRPVMIDDTGAPVETWNDLNDDADDEDDEDDEDDDAGVDGEGA